ncbi:MAG TPA: SIMPL domain-containing protein [Gemmatimonadaceae bacterium]|nr:SIMPL domain-containing protein [Gemmatimonadaceae bacterium]
MALERATWRTIILAAGMLLAGLAVGQGFLRARLGDRFVTVKGISEREVRADLAIWPLRIAVSDDDLARAQTRIESHVREIFRFLVRHQLDTAQVTLQDFVVSDLLTQEYRPAGAAGNRFIIRQTIVVRSDAPDRVRAASQRVGELVNAGVVLSSGAEYGMGGPTFVFRGLNALKPAMIAEATARAREAATQFAQDSRTSLGGIRRANQGIFEILPRDQAQGITEASQIDKTIRVVSTVEYTLR